jgi:hypothetical protein
MSSAISNLTSNETSSRERTPKDRAERRDNLDIHDFLPERLMKPRHAGTTETSRKEHEP